MRPGTRQTRQPFEVDEAFYEKYEDIANRLAIAERDLVIYTDGLAALEKKLMQDADDAFFNQHKKHLAEVLQRRDAKANPEFTRMIRAKAQAQSQRTALRSQLDIMKMRFEEWRTRSADRRNSM